LREGKRERRARWKRGREKQKEKGLKGEVGRKEMGEGKKGDEWRWQGRVKGGRVLTWAGHHEEEEW
jgi:hypothetical protein